MAIDLGARWDCRLVRFLATAYSSEQAAATFGMSHGRARPLGTIVERW